MTTTTRVALPTIKGANAHMSTLPEGLKGRLTDILAASSKDTLTAADIAQAMIDTGLLPNKGTANKDARNAQGLILRTFIRRHNAAQGNRVGHVKGTLYAGTVAEALKVAAAFTGKVAPEAPKA